MPGDNQTRDDGVSAEEDRITTIGELRAEQDRQAGVLDELLDLVRGGQQHGQRAVRTAHDTDREAVGRRLDRGSRVQDEMRQAIRDVRAEEQAEEARRQHDADHARIRQQPEPEHQPREVMVSGKARLQRLLFGADK